jgi:hypothetical protein
MSRESVNVIVFSLSTPLDKVILLINNCTTSQPCLCVSTHKLYDLEENKILNSVLRSVYFKCFADFLTDEEMSWCDYCAYEIENDKLSEEKNLLKYYDYIKKEKNKLVFNNICKKYNLLDKYLCAQDLGIDEFVWLRAGFISSLEQGQTQVNVDYSLFKPKKFKNPLSLYLRYSKTFLNSFKKIFLIKTSVGNYIFLGSVIRIRPYLEGVDIQELKYNFIDIILAAVKTIISTRPFKLLTDIEVEAKKIIIKRYIKQNNISKILTTIHEYDKHFNSIAESVKIELVALQDGYLPENYSSKYLHYLAVDKFYVWDRLSLGLFENQKLKAEICPFLYISPLPSIEKDRYEIKTILVLTSGAGDWTALKNRSDEDQMVILFARIAEHFPDTQIIYRCHPLWAHPAHQGIDSIKRVDRYFDEKGIKNIRVSEESNTLAKQFMKTQILGFQQSSLDRDLDAADLIFGEHSFTMIDGARKGKLFASVNVTKRRDFFHNYTKLGFPHLTSYDDIIFFINELRSSPQRLLAHYNEAVYRYNNEWYR